MRASLLWLLLPLLLQVCILAETQDWCTSSLASVSITKNSPLGDKYSRTEKYREYLASGRVNSTAAPTGYFSGTSPTGFTVFYDHVEQSGAVTGTLYLTDEQGGGARVRGKNWNPRFHRHSSRQGLFTGHLNVTSKRLCSQVCFTSRNETKKQCGYLLAVTYPLERNIDNLFVSGEIRSVLPSTDMNYVSPMKLVGVTRGSYKYTKLEDAERACAAAGEKTSFPSLSLQLSNWSVCHTGLMNVELDITSNVTCSKRDCYPFVDDGTSGYRTVLFNSLECDADGRVHGLLRQLHDSNRVSSSYANTLAVEGGWSGDKLCMIACQASSSPKDCSILVTVQFPLEFSIHQRSPVIGKLTSQRQETDPLFFKPLGLGAASQMFRLYNYAPGNFTYVYSKTKQAEGLCTEGSGFKGSGFKVYPSGDYFQDFYIDGRAADKQEFNVYPVSLDSKLHWYRSSSAGLVASMYNSSFQEPVKKTINISFAVTIGGEYIAAEGVYDSERGTACLIGCRAVNVTSPDLEEGKDCRISVRVQFAPMFGESGHHRTTVTVSSLRGKQEELYFKTMKLTSYQEIFMDEAKWKVWVKDLEIFLCMVTLSLELVALTFQVVHARRQPKLRPYASLVMLFILVLGHSVPLVLNFEAVFSKDGSSDSPDAVMEDGSFLQVKEVAIRLMNMSAFLLLLWLLHLVWNSRPSETENTSASSAELSTFGESSRLLSSTGQEEEQQLKTLPASTPVTVVRERNVLLVCMPLYVVGALATSIRQLGLGRGLWSGLKAYAGLTLDFFLVPQAVAYFVWGVKAPALSPAFYVGMTVGRMVPHGFDMYRSLKPAFDTDTDIFFANRDWDFFSLAWDVAIPCGAVVVAVVVFLQQRYGGRFVR